MKKTLLSLCSLLILVLPLPATTKPKPKPYHDTIFELAPVYGAVLDVATWTSQTPSVLKFTAPGKAEYQQLGVMAYTTTTVSMPIGTCTTDGICPPQEFTISWKSMVAVTYANWTGDQSPAGQNTLCGGTQVGACTPETMPVLAPINGIYIGKQYNCSGPPAGQKWELIIVLRVLFARAVLLRQS